MSQAKNKVISQATKSGNHLTLVVNQGYSYPMDLMQWNDIMILWKLHAEIAKANAKKNRKGAAL